MGRIWLLLLLLFFAITSDNVYAQQKTQLGIMPSLNVNKKLPRDWSLNFKAESRQLVFQEAFDFDYVLTDISLIAATRVRLRTTIGGGYLARITEDGIRHRAIQQISIARSYAFFRLAHRISMDQTFEAEEDPEFRFRYRLSSEVPLQGQTLDPGEFFLKLSNEYLNAFQAGEYGLEIRTAAFAGYALSPASKFELGLEYRADSFIQDQARHRLWLGINFFQTI